MFYLLRLLRSRAETTCWPSAAQRLRRGRSFGEDRICSVLEFCRTFVAQIWSRSIQALKRRETVGLAMSCFVETESSGGPALHAEQMKLFSWRKRRFAACSAEVRRSTGPAPCPPLAKGLQSQIPVRAARLPCFCFKTS